MCYGKGKPELIACAPCVSMPDKKQLKRHNLRKHAEKCLQHVVEMCHGVVQCGGQFVLQVPVYMGADQRHELQSRLGSAVGQTC